MYAVVKTGGKQYRVAANDVIKVEKLAGKEGETVLLDNVLMLGGDTPTIGQPLVEGASVGAEILEQARDKKIVVFKKRRRQNYRRKKGHRQHMTVLRVKEIFTDGKGKDFATARPFVDDVSLIGGVGPKLKEALEAAGVTSLRRIARMDDAALAKLGVAIEQGDRPVREEWGQQARELVAGEPPRAKVDQDAADMAEKE